MNALKPGQIEAMKEGGHILAEILRELMAAVRPGIRTDALSEMAKGLMAQRGVQASFLGYRNYPDVICLSVNRQCVHTPGSDYVLQEGDVLKLDFGVLHKGFHTDTAATMLVTNLSKEEVKEKLEYKERRKLIAVTRECLEKAVSVCRPDGHLGDIGAVIQEHAEHNGFSVAAELGGHGVGKTLHEEPWIANFGKWHAGPRLEAGMIFAIEPIINAGDGKIKDGADGFTYETADGSLSAHFEHTVLITDKGPLVLTV